MSSGGFVNFELEPGAADKLAGYFEHSRQRIVTAIRAGMRQAMQDLAQYIVSAKLSGGVLRRRSGRLAEAVLDSVRIKANEEVVAGSLNAKPRGMPNEGYWQEFGTHHPALTGKLRAFALPDGSIVFTRKVREFDIAAKPFMNPALREQEAAIVETIRARLRQELLS